MEYIKCTCGKEYNLRQAQRGFIGKVNGEKCCLKCADHRQMKIIEKNAFGISL